MGGLRARKSDSTYATEEQIIKLSEDLELSARETKFCNEFVIDYNVTKAAKRSGIGKSAAYGYMKKPRVLIAIRQIQDLYAAYDGITPRTLQGQMAVWAFSNIGDYFSEGWKLKNPEELTRPQLSCIKAIEKRYDGNGLPVFKLTLHDAVKANENLSRAFELYESSKLNEIHKKVQVMESLTKLHQLGQIDEDELNKMVSEVNDL